MPHTYIYISIQFYEKFVLPLRIEGVGVSWFMMTYCCSDNCSASSGCVVCRALSREFNEGENDVGSVVGNVVIIVTSRGSCCIKSYT